MNINPSVSDGCKHNLSAHAFAHWSTHAQAADDIFIFLNDARQDITHRDVRRNFLRYRQKIMLLSWKKWIKYWYLLGVLWCIDVRTFCSCGGTPLYMGQDGILRQNHLMLMLQCYNNVTIRRTYQRITNIKRSLIKPSCSLKMTKQVLWYKNSFSFLKSTLRICIKYKT